MFKLNRIKLGLAILISSFSLTACGVDSISSSVNSSYESFDRGYSYDSVVSGAGSYKNTLDYKMESPIQESEIEADSISEDRKLIRTVSLGLRAETSEDLPAIMNTIKEMAGNIGGYSESSNIRATDWDTYADITLRIPKNEVDNFLDGIESLNLTVVNSSDNSEDVTLRYTDIESRLRVKETARDKYMAYLERATTVEEILQIEERLNETIEDIESSKAQLNRMSGLIEYSTVEINLSCRKNISPEMIPIRERISERLGEFADGLIDFALDGFEWCVQALLSLVFIIPVMFVFLRAFLFTIHFGKDKKKLASDRKSKFSGLIDKLRKRSRKEVEASNTGITTTEKIGNTEDNKN